MKSKYLLFFPLFLFFCSGNNPSTPDNQVNPEDIVKIEGRYSFNSGSVPDRLIGIYLDKDSVTEKEIVIDSGNPYIRQLPNLNKYLNTKYLSIYSFDKLNDISGISNLRNLNYLYVVNCDSLCAINAIDSLSNITHLDLFGCPISDFSYINNLKKLKYLDIKGWNTATSNISFLTDKTDLETLGVCINNSSVSLTPLSNLINLKILDIEDTAWFNDSSISLSLSFINNLTNLKSLYLATQCSNLTPINVLTGLSLLSIQYNYILTDLSPISSLINLTTLSLTEIGRRTSTDCNVLGYLPQIHTLYMRYCNFQDYSPLFNCLTAGDTLFYGGNYGNYSTVIDSLTNNGVIVYAGVTYYLASILDH